MHSSRISFAFLLAVLAGSPVVHAASICPGGNVLSTPTADFTIDNVNHVVTHLKTGLMWKQCAEGLSTTTTACDTGGSATSMNWSAALSAAATPFAGYSDWRLPNQKELESIVETGCHAPSINETAFPATPPDYFWSSTASESAPDEAWYVDFNDGRVPVDLKTYSYFVRLVRGGQSFDSFDAQATPPTPPAPTAIPTLSEWGVILLAGGLGLFGMGVMRRRSRGSLDEA